MNHEKVLANFVKFLHSRSLTWNELLRLLNDLADTVEKYLNLIPICKSQECDEIIHRHLSHYHKLYLLAYAYIPLAV